MKTPNSKLIRWAEVGLLVGIGLFSVTSCAKKNITVIDQIPPTVMSVDETITPTPELFARGTVENLLASGPSPVTIEPLIQRTPSGNGFVFQLTWKFSGPAPQDWKVNLYTDDNAGSAPTVYMGISVFRSNDLLKYDSRELVGNRIYKFELLADINQPDIVGQIVYKTITINLRGIK